MYYDRSNHAAKSLSMPQLFRIVVFASFVKDGSIRAGNMSRDWHIGQVICSVIGTAKLRIQLKANPSGLFIKRILTALLLLLL